MDNQKEKKDTGTVRLGRVANRPYWVLILSIFVRAVHQVGAAVFLGSFLLLDSRQLPQLYLVIASVTGCILLVTEGLRHRQMLKELSGVTTIIKLIILGLVYHAGLPAKPSVLFIFISAAVFSHAPKSIRHRLLF